MKKENFVSEDELRDFSSLASLRFKSLYSLTTTSLKSAVSNNIAREELSDVLNKVAHSFGTTYTTVYERLGNEAVTSDVSSLYASYIASNIVQKDLESLASDFQQSDSIKEVASFDFSKALSSKSNYTLVANILTSYADILASSSDAVSFSSNFFGSLSNELRSSIAKSTNSSTFEMLKSASWTVGEHTIDGIVEYKKPVTKERDIPNVEKSKFYVPMRELSIPENRILPRDKIIGDEQIMLECERAVKLLFFYDHDVKKNPAMVSGNFNNFILLQGTAGTGKGAMSYYLIDFAKRFANEVGTELVVTTLDIESSYENGTIQKMKSQLQQLVNNPIQYLVFMDEVDALLSKGVAGHQSKTADQVNAEWNKFADGEYPITGKNLYLATINDATKLSSSNRGRFQVYNWRGAQSAKEKGTLFQYKLASGISNGYISLSDSQAFMLGELAFNNELSGRDINTISKNLLSNSFRWDNLGDIYEQKGDFEKQVSMFEKNHNSVPFDQTYAAVEAFIATKIEVLTDSLKFQQS